MSLFEAKLKQAALQQDQRQDQESESRIAPVPTKAIDIADAGCANRRILRE